MTLRRKALGGRRKRCAESLTEWVGKERQKLKTGNFDRSILIPWRLRLILPSVTVLHAKVLCSRNEKLSRPCTLCPVSRTCCRPSMCPWVATSSRSAVLCHLSFCRMLPGSSDGSSASIRHFSSIHSITSATSCFHSYPGTRGEWVSQSGGEDWYFPLGKGVLGRPEGKSRMQSQSRGAGEVGPGVTAPRNGQGNQDGEKDVSGKTAERGLENQGLASRCPVPR